MNPYRSIGRAGLAWRSAASVADEFWLWAPLIPLGVIYGCLLILLFFFHWKWVAPLGVPLVEFLGGEEATHYPAHLNLLPSLLTWPYFVIGAVLLPLVQGDLTRRFSLRFGSAAESFSVLRFAPRLVLLGLLTVSLRLGLEFVAERVLTQVGRADGSTIWMFRFVAATVTHTLMAYGVAWVVLRGRPVVPAIRGSYRLARRSLATTALVVGVPLLVITAFRYLRVEWSELGAAMRPELIFIVVLGGVVVELLLVFAWVGGVTRLFLSQSGQGR